MNYYKRHLGDYARKTAHLSLLEHGVYTVLLDRYYDLERSISELEAIRFTRASTNEEIAAVKNVLREFFSEENGHFSQCHADEVIADFHKRQKTNRKLGSIGGKRNAKRIASEAEAKEKPSHKPLAISHKEEIAQALPNWLPEKTWKDFLAMRKSIRRPMTDVGIERLIAKLTKMHAAGVNVVDALDNSIVGSYQGVFDPSERKGGTAAPTKPLEFRPLT